MRMIVRIIVGYDSAARRKHGMDVPRAKETRSDARSGRFGAQTKIESRASVNAEVQRTGIFDCFNRVRPATLSDSW
jgi:hypothetical protein